MLRKQIFQFFWAGLICIASSPVEEFSSTLPETIMICFQLRFRRRNLKGQLSEAAGSVKIFSYRELRKATNNFSATNKLGEGGFGSVYKAKLKDGSVVAVKVLSAESKQGAREFLNEINMIADIVHENLVRLLGCCIEKHRILVYRFIENNSLSQTLLAGNCDLNFSWKTRAKICIGIARGLAFLHEEVHPHIVHRDIKASNILLDKDLNPKIADFGLARLLPPNKTYVSTRVAGTMGYLAPEYAVRGRLTRRADVYSFGVLLLEIVSGKCNKINPPLDETSLPGTSSDLTQKFLLYRAWYLHERNELVAIVDESLNGDFDAEEALRFLKVVLLCTQDSSRLRPTMSTVIKMLTGEIDVCPEEITKPGLISDFMDLKVVTLNKDENRSNKASISSTGTSSLESAHASLSFTAVCDRDS